MEVGMDFRSHRSLALFLLLLSFITFSLELFIFGGEIFPFFIPFANILKGIFLAVCSAVISIAFSTFPCTFFRRHRAKEREAE